MKKVRKTEKKGIKCKTKTTNMRMIITITKETMKFSLTVPKAQRLNFNKAEKL